MAEGQQYDIVDFGYRALDAMRLEKAYRLWGVDVWMGKHDIAVAPAVHRDGFDVLGRIETPWAEHVLELGADLAFELFERLRFELVAIELQLLLDGQPRLLKVFSLASGGDSSGESRS